MNVTRIKLPYHKQTVDFITNLFIFAMFTFAAWIPGWYWDSPLVSIMALWVILWFLAEFGEALSNKFSGRNKKVRHPAFKLDDSL